ncbi:hypothetical protein JCM3765_000702 [Sporobolomyces pararoseus]
MSSSLVGANGSTSSSSAVATTTAVPNASSPAPPPPNSNLSTSKTSSANLLTGSGGGGLNSSNSVSYHQEISSMIYVFTSIKPQHSNSSVATIQFIQDVVQSELINLILLSKQQASRTNNSPTLPSLPSTSSTSTTSSSTTTRGSSQHSTTLQQQQVQIGIEDVLFMLEKKTRAEPTTTTSGGGGVIDEDEGIDGIEEPDKNLKVVGKSLIHLSWELGDPWKEYLIDGTSSSNVSVIEGSGGGGGILSKEEERAYKINREILKEANEMTEKMTREEYEQYSLARQASFVYRKSKKFRDFLLLDTATSLTDELLDILGFLAYELVRTLSRIGIVQARTRLISLAAAQQEQEENEKDNSNKKRKQSEEGEERGGELDPNSKDFPSVLRPAPPTLQNGKKKRKTTTTLEPIVSLFSAPIESESTTITVEGGGREQDSTTTQTTQTTSSTTINNNSNSGGVNESKKPPTPPQPVVVVKSLELKDLQNGFWYQTHAPHLDVEGEGGTSLNDLGNNNGCKIKMGKGLKSWRGGIGSVKGNSNTLL